MGPPGREEGRRPSVANRSGDEGGLGVPGRCRRRGRRAPAPPALRRPPGRGHPRGRPDPHDGRRRLAPGTASSPGPGDQVVSSMPRSVRRVPPALGHDLAARRALPPRRAAVADRDEEAARPGRSARAETDDQARQARAEVEDAPIPITAATMPSDPPSETPAEEPREVADDPYEDVPPPLTATPVRPKADPDTGGDPTLAGRPRMPITRTAGLTRGSLPDDLPPPCSRPPTTARRPRSRPRSRTSPRTRPRSG